MTVGTRTILMRTAAVLFVGLVPAYYFSGSWTFADLRSGKLLVYGPVAIASIACVAYALFENSLRRRASFFVGVFATAAPIALLWSFLLPIAVSFSSPGSFPRSPYWVIAALCLHALMPLLTAITLFAWARRASRSAETNTSGQSLLAALLGLAAMLLAPIASQLLLSRCEHSVTERILAASDEEGRQIASDVGAWKHLAGWREFERAVLSEWGQRGAGSDGPTAPAGPRASHLSDCYVRITGHHARNW